MCKKHFWNGAPWTDESLLDICGWHGPCYVWWKANTAFHAETLACGGNGVSVCRCFAALRPVWLSITSRFCSVWESPAESRQALSSQAEAKATQGHAAWQSSKTNQKFCIRMAEEQEVYSFGTAKSKFQSLYKQLWLGRKQMSLSWSGFIWRTEPKFLHNTVWEWASTTVIAAKCNQLLNLNDTTLSHMEVWYCISCLEKQTI